VRSLSRRATAAVYRPSLGRDGCEPSPRLRARAASIGPGITRAHAGGEEYQRDAGVGIHRDMVPLPTGGGDGTPGRGLASGRRCLRGPRRRLRRRANPHQAACRGASIEVSVAPRRSRPAQWTTSPQEGGATAPALPAPSASGSHRSSSAGLPADLRASRGVGRCRPRPFVRWHLEAERQDR
jgi:hypothetical protein